MPVRVRVLTGATLRALDVERKYWNQVKFDALPALAAEGVRKLKEEVPVGETGELQNSIRSDYRPDPKSPSVSIWCDIWYDRYVQGVGRTSPHDIISSSWIVFEKEGRSLVFPPGRVIHHPGSKKTDYYGITATHMLKYMENLINSMIRMVPR